MTNPTPEQLLKCAEIVESDREWEIKGDQYVVLKRVAGTTIYYVPFQDEAGARDDAQQLRIRKHLDDQCAFLTRDSKFNDEFAVGVAFIDNEWGYLRDKNVNVITHKNSDIAAILAVLALEGE